MERPRLAAYGHSWVAGEGATAPSCSFVGQLFSRLDAVLLDRSAGGSSSRDTARLLEREGCPAADLYMLMTGLNDARLHGLDPNALRTYQRCVDEAFVRFAFTAPGATVVSVEQPPLVDYSRYPPHDRGSDEAVAAHNVALRGVCVARGGTVVTVDGWDPRAMLHEDTVHPNDAGHALIAAAVLSTLDGSSMASTRPVHD